MSNYATSSLLRFLLLSILALAGAGLHGQNKTWTNGNATGMWEDGGNWSPAGAPTASSRVIFNNTSTAACTINSNPTIARLTIESTYTGPLSLGNRNLTVAGNITIANATGFTSGTSGKVTITARSTVDCLAPFSNLEINTAVATDRVRFRQETVITGGLTILQVGRLTGSNIRVGGAILITDPDLDNRAYISAMGAGVTLSAVQLRNLNVEAGASLQLLSDVTLNNNFQFTGSGTVTGANKLILGSNGRVDFSGTVSNVRISTALSTENVRLSQNFNITGDLDITQVNSLNGFGQEIRVSGNINVTDADINGSATLVLAGSNTNSFQGVGGGNYRRLAVDKANATARAQLNSSDAFFSVTVNKGVLDLNGQTVGAPVTVNAGGTLGGNGTVADDVDCNAGGIVSPGNSPGTMTITGNLTVSGTLEMEITGPGDGGGGAGVAGSDFDQIIVSGTATITTLKVVFLGMPSPSFPVSGHFYTLISGTASITNLVISPINVNGFLIGGGFLLIGNPALPIELTHFSGVVKGQAIQLYWNTATEQNNDYMAVERSADGVQFAELGRVKGAGTTEQPQQYHFVDEKPLPGLNYYRLRQVDFDGAFEYHKIISVLFEGKGNGLGVQSFPNPAQDVLQARWAPSPTQPTTLLLLDIAGRKVAEYQVAPGVNTFEAPLNGLPAGVYFLQAMQGLEVEVMRFLKQ